MKHVNFCKRLQDFVPIMRKSYSQLRANFEMIGTSHLESDFWISRIESTDSLSESLQAWYIARLAQFYSRRRKYKVCEILHRGNCKASSYGRILDTVSLDIGSDVREFWRSIVESTPDV